MNEPVSFELAKSAEEFLPQKKRKKRGKSPTSRAMDYCRKHGWIAGIVEKTVPKSFIKQDLFGFADILILDGGPPMLVQVTSGANHAARQTKINGNANAQAWHRVGGRVEVWSFAKRGERGKRKLWTMRRECGTYNDSTNEWTWTALFEHTEEK